MRSSLLMWLKDQKRISIAMPLQSKMCYSVEIDSKPAFETLDVVYLHSLPYLDVVVLQLSYKGHTVQCEVDALRLASTIDADVLLQIADGAFNSSLENA